MLTLITLILVLMLVFFKMKISKEFINPIEKLQSIHIKGLLSLLIMLGHIFAEKQITKSSIDILITSPGFLYVGMFFFYSGFGLVQGYKNNSNYLNNFLPKKFQKIYVPFVLMNIIYYFVLKIFLEFQKVSFIEFIKEILGFSLINGISWYIISILYFYFIFYLSFKYFYRIRYIIFFSFMLLYTLICIYLNKNASWWYISIIPIFIGIIYSEKEDSIGKILKKYYYLILIGAASLFNIFYFIRFNKIAYFLGIELNEKINILFGMLAVIFFVFLVLLVLMKIKIENIVTLKLGEISFEIYLYHGLFLKLFMSDKIFIKNECIYVILCVVCTLILSIFVKKITKKFGIFY